MLRDYHGDLYMVASGGVIKLSLLIFDITCEADYIPGVVVVLFFISHLAGLTWFNLALIVIIVDLI